jgi:hypothetical protein
LFVCSSRSTEIRAGFEEKSFRKYGKPRLLLHDSRNSLSPRMQTRDTAGIEYFLVKSATPKAVTTG